MQRTLQQRAREAADRIRCDECGEQSTCTPLMAKACLKVLFADMLPHIQKIDKHETTDSISTNVVRVLALEGHQPS